jgi:hypothetical protein
MKTTSAGCLLAALGASATAAAAPPGQTAPFPAVTVAPAAPASAPVATAEPPTDRPVGYRLDLAVVDLASAAVIGAGVALGSDELTASGAMSLFFAVPIAHAVLGNPRSSPPSFAARAGLPVLGLLGGAGLGALVEGNEEAAGAYAASGMIAGGVTALLIDYGFLARRRVAERPGQALAIVPIAGGAGFGLGGRF